KPYRLKDELAGKRVRCVKCNAVFQVPEQDVETGFEVVESTPEPAQAVRPSLQRPPPPMARPRFPRDDEPNEPRPRRPKKRRRSGDRDRGGGFHISISPG